MNRHKLLRVLKPCDPVLPHEKICVVIYAKDQPEYLPLPAIRSKAGVVTTRWHMCWRDRWLALLTGDVYVQLHTFNKPLQPLRVCVVPPKKEDVI